MNLRKSGRKAAILLALAFALAAPGQALAVSTTGTINESGTAAVSVSATIPTSASYTFVSGKLSSSIPISAINSTFAGGLTMSAMPNSGGSNVFAPDKRSIVATGTGWTATPGAATEGYWSSSTQKPIAIRPGDASGDSVTLASSVSITAAGSYTGTLQVSVVTTN
jgi:hypothetical protein